VIIDADPSRIRWPRVLVAGVSAALLPLLAIFVVVMVFAFVSAVQVRGAPDSARIARFANAMGAWLAPPVAVAATAAAGAWVARKVRSRVQLHGVLVGGVAAILGLAVGVAETRSFRAGALLLLAAGVAAGWLGARLAGRGPRTT
jgi:hypothetical protein